MKTLAAFILLLFLSNTTIAQDNPAYLIYDSNGKKVSYAKMISALSKSEIVLFGEQHNNAIAHWLQLEVTVDLGKSNDLVLGAEMFEKDNQDELNLYLSGAIDAKALDTLARMWSNYKTDYAPLVDYAKENSIPFVASNIPRRYANMVYKKGFSALDSLSAEEKSWIAPLPIPYDSLLPTYVNILEMMGEHGTPELVKAQAIKDATMAYSISKNIKSKSIFIHYNGCYHSDHYEGILWYLQQYMQDVNAKTITTVTQDKVTKLDKEHKGKADFIICVNENVTTTY